MTSPSKAILAGGCFWNLQERIRNQPGVVSTRVGYAGGDTPNPTYDHCDWREIVTEVTAVEHFWEGESEHQDYLQKQS